MSILTRYLSYHILKNIVSVLLVLIIVLSIFSVLAELEIVEGSNRLKLISLFWLLEIIMLCYELIPFAVLLGTVLGLSNFVGTNQLLIMQISGFSIKHRFISIAYVGIIIFFFSFFLGEFAVPAAKKLRAEIQLSMGEKRDITLTDRGFWARSENFFLKVDNLKGSQTVEGVELYEFNNSRELLSILTAKSGFYNDSIWIFEGSEILTFKPKYSIERYDSPFERQLPIGPKVIEMVVNEQEDDSIFSLLTYLKIARNTGQVTDDLYLNIFQKFSYWINIFAFLVLSHLLIKTGTERFSGSKHIIIAVFVGFGYFIFGKILNQAGLVFSYPPFIIAIMPSFILLLVIYILTIRRI